MICVQKAFQINYLEICFQYRFGNINKGYIVYFIYFRLIKTDRQDIFPNLPILRNSQGDVTHMKQY